MMDEDLLQKLPLKRTWLADIVDVFLKRPNGIAEIDAVVNALLRTEREMGAEGEATVTRTINNFCVNARDLERNAKHRVFERVGPATYKLRSFPERPDLIEIQNVEFSDRAYEYVWKRFIGLAKKDPKWETLTKRQRLEAFVRNIEEQDWMRRLLKEMREEAPIWSPKT